MELRFKRKAGVVTTECRMVDQVPYLYFPLLEHTGMVKHGFSTKLGGVSTGDFSEMNLSFTRGDKEESVRENYRRICKAIGISSEKIVLSHQTHTTNIKVVTEEDAGKGIEKPRDYENIDGLVTNVPGLVLTTFYADCVPLYFLDPVKKVIGLSHSGWRGTVNRMGKCTIDKMNEVYGSDPKDILACIGPSICKSCYEIGEEVAMEFQKAFGERKEEILTDKLNGKFHLDLWRANKVVLEEAGILEEHMAVTDICTMCNSDLLYSHRVMGDKRGNLAAFLSLNE